MQVCDACGFDAGQPVAAVATLRLDASYPSQNQLGANRRGNAGYHYRKLRQEFAAELHRALAATPVPPATGKRRVWLHRVFGPRKRPYDIANLIGGGKAIVDVLVARGILVDDSSKWFEGIYKQGPGPADAITIEIFDVLPIR